MCWGVSWKTKYLESGTDREKRSSKRWNQQYNSRALQFNDIHGASRRVRQETSRWAQGQWVKTWNSHGPTRHSEKAESANELAWLRREVHRGGGGEDKLTEQFDGKRQDWNGSLSRQAAQVKVGAWSRKGALWADSGILRIEKASSPRTFKESYPCSEFII